MATTAGEVLGYKAPGSGETVRLPVMLLDSDGAVVTGVTFDAAGMEVWTKKEGASSFTLFPTFGTDNWDEIGYGLYEVIIRQSDADELALLNTEGAFHLYVKATATRGDVFMFKVNPADVARDDQWTDTRAGKVDTIATDVAGLDGAAMRGTDGAYTGTPPTAAAIADAVWDETSTGHTDTGKAGVAVWTTIPAISTILTGITSLAAWLKGLFRKDTMDATAKSEVNTGGGTYDESTDSQEGLSDSVYTGTPPTAAAIADQVWDEAKADHVAAGSMGAQLGAAALEATLTAMKGTGWTDETMVAILAACESVAGSGVNTVTVTFTDDTGAVIPSVWIKAKAGSATYWAKTSTAGVATFLLDDGDYEFWPASSTTYTWNSGAGYYEGTVSGTTALAFSASLISIPAASDPSLCAVYWDVKWSTGVAVGANDAYVQIEQVTSPAFPTASSEVAASVASVGSRVYSDSAGRVQFNAIRGVVMNISMKAGTKAIERKKLTVPSAASANLLSYIE